MRDDDLIQPMPNRSRDAGFDSDCPRCTAELAVKVAQHIEMLVQQPSLKKIEEETYFDPKIKAQMELVQDMRDSASVLQTHLGQLVRQLEGERILPRAHTHQAGPPNKASIADIWEVSD